MSLLFPTRCIFCREWISPKQHGLCMQCREQAEAEMRTVYCSPVEYTEEIICAGRYEGALKHALIQLKFQQYGSQVLLPMTELMEQAWQKHRMPLPEVITSVPMSPIRIRTRGYNQSEEIAKQLAKRWDVPFVPVLQRRMLSKMQSKLAMKKRWDNARKSFCLRKNIQIDGKNVLLVDDIVTTGATVSCCAALLKKAGARSVWVLAAAKTDA